MKNVNQNQGVWAEPTQLNTDNAFPYAQQPGVSSQQAKDNVSSQQAKDNVSSQRAEDNVSSQRAEGSVSSQQAEGGVSFQQAEDSPSSRQAAGNAVSHGAADSELVRQAADDVPSQQTMDSGLAYLSGNTSVQQPADNTSARQTVNSISVWQNDTTALQSGGAPDYAAGKRIMQFAETEETKKLKENYGFFGISAFFYAVFYTFCMFHNGSGVTFPFFVAGSLLLLYLYLSKLGVPLKKGSIYYMASMILLGISTFLTDDWRIIFYNKLGIFLLMISLLLKQFFDTSKWNLGKYLSSIIQAVFLCLGELLRPIQDGALYQKNKKEKKSRTAGYVLIGLAISVPLLLIVLALLASADAFFLEMVMKVFGYINLPNIINIILRISYMFFFSYMLIAYLCKRQIKEEVKDHRTGEPVIAITVTTMLTFVYLIFSIVQITGLFLGKLQLPEGYTYAGYARRGFFQLLLVSVLNLVIVLVCMGFFRRSKVLKVILTVMSLCTFVMIASSAMRMAIYIRFYYLTFMRILVLWALALLTVLFLGILVNIYVEKFPLFRYSMAVVTVFYLVLSFARPDYIIAEVNIANVEEQSRQWWVDESVEPYHDFKYLGSLSADAAPVMVPYLDSLGYDFQAFEREDALEYMRRRSEHSYVSRWETDGFGYWWMRNLQRNTENFGFRTFNLSRYTAMKLLRQAQSVHADPYVP